MAGIDDIIGGWVRDAEKTGEIRKLPGYGKPLNLDEDRHVPARYRMAYRILKNAGYSPPEVEMIRQLAVLKVEVDAEKDPARRELLEAQSLELQQKLDVALDKFKS